MFARFLKVDKVPETLRGSDDSLDKLLVLSHIQNMRKH